MFKKQEERFFTYDNIIIYTIRRDVSNGNMQCEDYYVISPLINEWWGGRQMSDMLPKLFFDHFNNTSFIAEKDGQIIGFLIGFLSQSNTDVAYIHFFGVYPYYRKNHIGKQLFNEFFNVVKKNNRNVVRAVT